MELFDISKNAKIHKILLERQSNPSKRMRKINTLTLFYQALFRLCQRQPMRFTCGNELHS